jgi:serine/threonine protein kinase/Tfp pilus assembly protein PilF
MVSQKPDIQAIFSEAISLASDEDRGRFLDEVCGGDASVRSRVDALLCAHSEAGGFFGGQVAAPAATEILPRIAEYPGTVIGPYKLLQQIGEGGMGVVFMAEQSEPIQRTVALKIIKPGMDTRQVMARFEAERQALAMMDHPNIAKVLDAGTTGEGARNEERGASDEPSIPILAPRSSLLAPHSGRPFFVMELVKGVPITRYCDEKHLSLRERLDLFIQVCQAVQHAHQKGIIHRDIKPTNVIVAEYDNHAVPKVIDFGVAKATAQKLTERTMFTEFGQVVGTIEYMSPEQAKLNQLDIDTRSDIYSLGVLLYELLTGTTPFERKRLQEAAFDEMLRIIREDEPPKPSTKLSTSDTLPSIAANRHTEPARLSKDVHGDLDWIVMKALEKDRARRYDSAANFAADIERHLNDKPVVAGPPSSAYRFRKFVKRNRAALAAGTLVALAMLVALGGITSGIGWAVRDRAAQDEQLAQERAARQARITGQLEVILEEVASLQQAEKWHEALLTARRAEAALAAGEAETAIQERARQALADLNLVRRLEEIRADSGTVWGSWNRVDTTRVQRAGHTEKSYAAALSEAGIDVDTLPVREAAARITAREQVAAAVLPALDDWVAVRSKSENEAATQRLVEVLRAADPDPWRQQVRDALRRKDWSALENLARSPDVDRQPAATISFLCAALRAQAESDIGIGSPGNVEGELGARGFDMEIDLLRRAQFKYPNDFWINHRLGVDLMWRLSPEVVVAEGIGFMRAAVAVRPESGHALMNLGNGYSFLGEYDQAIACYRKALELEKPYWACQSNLGESLARKGLFEEAIAAFEEAIRISPVHANHVRAELSMVYSCCTNARLRDVGRAANLAEKALQLEPDISNSWTALGVARFREGKWNEARAALNRSLELKTARGGSFVWDEAINWLFLAMSYWHDGQQGPARDAYDKAIQEIENGLAGRTDAEMLSHIYAEADELLTIADETTTAKNVDARGAAEAFAELGRLRARQGNFRQAAADYAKAIGLEPESAFIWFQGGSLLAHLGQREAFRKHCAAMLQQFGGTQDRRVAERTAKLMSSVPTDFSAVDPQQIVALADRALASGAPHEDIDIQWFHLAKGMADYRAGQFDSVLLSMKKAKTPHWPVRTVLADLYMAMAQFHLGDREASVKTLDGAVAMMMVPLPGRDDLGEHFHDYLFCQLARREAEALILDPAQKPTTNKESKDSADEVNE